MKRLVVMLTLLVVGLGMAENRIDLIRPDAPELAAHGEYGVGVRTLTLTNPDQLDIAGAVQGEPIPRYDRELTVELWYPAFAEEGARGEYRALTRDGATEVTLVGRGVRDAEANHRGAPYPLVVISHGYPGNRFLLAHLAENLASKGYVVASIDHRDSTYSDQTVFGSTLLNRPLDQVFVLDELERLAQQEGWLEGLLDAQNAGLVGYSMGGYGALNVVGAGFTEMSAGLGFAPPQEALAQRVAGNHSYPGADPRVRAAIAIGPWGMNAGFWDEGGLAGVTTPLLLMAGSKDDVSGFENGVRAIFEGAVNAERYLLVFENARHNAAAPIPAPQEVWGTGTFDHYADPVWDTVRMNNVAQHFATAFFGHYLKGEAEMAEYLDLVERSEEGVWSVGEDGEPTEEHTHWQGFPERSALGLWWLRGEAGQ
jgi:predicted dienelactone hydrolase